MAPALLERRVRSGAHWEGRLSSSALATATAVTALALARKAGHAIAPPAALVDVGIAWLLATKNPDGGWGDTPESRSNISTTALVWAALAHGSHPAAEEAAQSASDWIAREVGSREPRALAAALAARYGKDRTFSVPILTMCAISGRLGPGREAWALIPRLPFELAAFPRRMFKWLHLPVVSYALPALIAMGIARHRRGATWGPLAACRELAAPRVLRVLTSLQPSNGGFLEAVPLTAFVTMTLIAAGEDRHPVVTRGVEFLTKSVRADGSWPIDTNLATWVTTLAVNALAGGSGLTLMSDAERASIRNWLLAQQWTREHPYTGAAPGGWAWTDLPGGVPDADDTAGALVALAHLSPEDPKTQAAARDGVRWLLDLQNGDGGIPTFCRGWGALPFDRSGTELTAHALRAWAAWAPRVDTALQDRIATATKRAVHFLIASQRPDGSFVPLWFGNEHEPHEENPVYGTSRVILGLCAVRPLAPDAEAMHGRAVTWLLAAQGADGGWGGAPDTPASIEETSLAVQALAAVRSGDAALHAAVQRGLAWLTGATGDGREFPPSPIGFYFARLWYWEALYPVIFAAAAFEGASGNVRQV